jgi:hypothetical protein
LDRPNLKSTPNLAGLRGGFELRADDDLPDARREDGVRKR